MNVSRLNLLLPAHDIVHKYSALNLFSNLKLKIDVAKEGIYMYM